jgi:hypothetical protein
VRVYVPLTLSSLPVVLAAGEIGPAPMTAYAVTPALRESYAEGDAEELEYVALTHAAQASLRLIAADPTAARQRLVLAVDVPDAAVTTLAADETDRAAVHVTEVVPLAAVAAAQLDDIEAELAVVAAIEALPAADAGDDDAQFALDEVEAHELLWYDSSEVHLLAE